MSHRVNDESGQGVISGYTCTHMDRGGFKSVMGKVYRLISVGRLISIGRWVGHWEIEGEGKSNDFEYYCNEGG